MPLTPGQDGAHPTYCRLCEAQCGLIVKVKAGRIQHVGPDRAHPISQGHICVKGPAMQYITYDPDRVLHPLKRSGGPGEFTVVEWDEALADIATRLTDITTRCGRDSLAMYVGNPAAFATLHYAYAGAFAAAFGSGKIYGPLHVDTGAKHLACELIFGGPHRFTFPDLERCDFLLMLGANPMVSHMSLISEPLAIQKLEALAKRGSVVVVDPRRTETARRFEHVPILPDSDAWLLGAMLHVIFAQGLIDEQQLDARIDGWRTLRDALGGFSVEAASARCQVAPEQIQRLARRFASAKTAACYGRVGTNRGSFSTITNVFIEALNVVTGRFGAEGGWIIGSNPFGGTPLHPAVAYGARRSRIGDVPLLMGMTPGAELAADILTPGEGQTRAMFIDSGNPVLSHPDGQYTKRALQSLELLVAIDLYATESSRFADYILPATSFFERADINEIWCANAPRPWVQYTEAVIAPLGQARHEYQVYDEILERAAKPSPFGLRAGKRPRYKDAMAELFAARTDGLTLEKLHTLHPHGLQLAANVDAAQSWNNISHPDKRPRLWHTIIGDEIARLKASTSEAAADGLKLFGRRKLRSMNSWMHNDRRIVRSDVPTLLIHPDDAAKRQIRDGQFVRVRSKTSAIEVRAEISDEVIAGSVNYPHGWGHQGGWQVASSLEGANINALASHDPADCERVTGMCLLDGIPVSVMPITSSHSHAELQQAHRVRSSVR